MNDLTARWNERLERWSDRLNPLVVREVRQALKTRTFLLVFLLLLLLTWVGSSIGVIATSQQAHAVELGPQFFAWYLIALLICLLFATPAGAFFSMSHEFRDRAFEVLAISTLSPRKIINGKLNGAFVMTLVYASVLSPYLCLSYLLGGISLAMLALTMAWLLLASYTMTLFAIMLGSLATKPWIEVVNLVILLAASTITSAISYGVLGELGFRGGGVVEMAFALGCFLVFILFAALISYGVAQSQLTPTFIPLTYRRQVVARKVEPSPSNGAAALPAGPEVPAESRGPHE